MIVYTFAFDDETHFRFEVDELGDSSVESPDQPVPNWLMLEEGKCEGCSIPTGARTTCPAALSLQPLLASFGDRISHEEVAVTVELNDTEVHASMPAQNAVRSLMGLQLALSSCPVLSKLRPMARFHVPFGDPLHTLYRFVGMYLTAEHLREEQGLDSDQGLAGLLSLINELHDVNQQLAERIRRGSEQDVTVNSLIILDTLAMLLEVDIDASLAQLKPYFQMHLNEG